jgi:hypothetical protein
MVIRRPPLHQSHKSPICRLATLAKRHPQAFWDALARPDSGGPRLNVLRRLFDTTLLGRDMLI